MKKPEPFLLLLAVTLAIAIWWWVRLGGAV